MLLFITMARKQKTTSDVTFLFISGSSALSLNSLLIGNSWNEIQKVQFGWSLHS